MILINVYTICKSQWYFDVPIKGGMDFEKENRGGSPYKLCKRYVKGKHGVKSCSQKQQTWFNCGEYKGTYLVARAPPRPIVPKMMNKKGIAEQA